MTLGNPGEYNIEELARHTPGHRFGLNNENDIKS
jgi:hypothetical protein